MEAIQDGYTLRGYIAGKPGVYDPLSFLYRPVLPLAKSKYRGKLQLVLADAAIPDDQKEVEAEKLNIRMTAEHVVEWNLRDHEGRPVPVGPEAIERHFPARRWDRLFQIVSLGDQSDPLPGGQRLEHVDLVEAAKNSPRASG